VPIVIAFATVFFICLTFFVFITTKASLQK